MPELTVCDICAQSAGPFEERRLYSARREEKRKDATWSTSRVVLHLGDFKAETIRVCPECRRRATWFYLGPVLVAVALLVLAVLWFFIAPLIASNLDDAHRVWPFLIPVIAIFSVRPYIRHKAGSPDANLAENPVEMFSLDFYLVTRLMEKHHDRIYWTAKSYKRYKKKFQ